MLFDLSIEVINIMLILVFKFSCFVILLIYGVKTIISFFKYSSPNNIIPTLPIVYCIFAIWYIFLNLPLVEILAQNNYELMQGYKEIPGLLKTIGFVTGLTVSSAFLCNFAKSFYILHELDHGYYYYYSAWGEKLKQRKCVRCIEFILRLIIAVLFILLERSLHDLNKYTKANTNIFEYREVIQKIASVGFGLYGMLFGWLVFAKLWIIKKEVEWWKLRLQLVIIVGGCFNIGYIFLVSFKPSVFVIISFLFIALGFSSVVLFAIIKHAYSLCRGFIHKIKWK